MERAVRKPDICGKTIARLLQSPWEHSAEYSACRFYIELSDGSLLHIEDDSIELFASVNQVSEALQDIDTAPEFPALWLVGDRTGVGDAIAQVLVDYHGSVYLQLANQHFVRSELAEGQTALSVFNYEEFLRWARYWEFFDYWTGELVVFDNLRAIDLVISSSVNDLKLWQSSTLHLVIGRLNGGTVSDLLALPSDRSGDAWKARFVVSELGSYQVRVQRKQGEFVGTIQIDEAVLATGRVEIHVS